MIKFFGAFLLCVSISATEEKFTWIPQVGTVEFPKTFDLSRVAHRLDVFSCCDELYLSLTEMVNIDPATCQIYPKCGENLAQNKAAWKKIEKGTFLYPKRMSEDAISEVREIFLEGDKYYEAVCVDNDDLTCLQMFNPYSQWMTLLQDEIEDVRLGDMAIPMTHDSGTAGIDTESYLVDKNYLFSLGNLLVPEVIVNWSICQDAYLGDQLNAGFRMYDVRIADLISENDTFRWWHGLSSQPIFDDLEAIAAFAAEFPNEIIMLELWNFKQPGNSSSPTFPMNEERLDELHEILLGYLGDFMVPRGNLSSNPTVGEVLKTGRNIMTFMDDEYIFQKSDLYLPRSWVVQGYSGQFNPEDIFVTRTEILKDLKANNLDDITNVGSHMPAGGKNVAAGVIRMYGDHPLVDEIIGRLFPDLNSTDVIDPDLMSFEGLYVDLLTAAREGGNTMGMQARPPELYSSGYSVHYRGSNDMYRYWLARNNIYKNNLFSTDDSVATSTVPQTAVAFNSGNIKPEVAISFNGNPLTGYYYWANLTAYGGHLANYCSNISVAFSVSSELFDVAEEFDGLFEFVMVEGQYPPDAVVSVYTSSPGSAPQLLYAENIQTMISGNLDLYIRGSDLQNGSGFAYISRTYNLFSSDCDVVPEDGYENLITWNS